MTRKTYLGREAMAVLDHIKNHGTSSLDELLAAFAAVPRAALLKRLANLVDLGWLEKSRSLAGVKSWGLTARAREGVERVEVLRNEAPAKRRILVTPPAYVGEIAQPRRINHREGGYYVPGPGPTLRPGALDHKRFSSVGNRC